MDSFIYTSPSNSFVARLAVLGLDISKLHDLVLLFNYYESIGIKLEICSRMIVNKGKVVKAGRVDHIGEHQKAFIIVGWTRSSGLSYKTNMSGSLLAIEVQVNRQHQLDFLWDFWARGRTSAAAPRPLNTPSNELAINKYNYNKEPKSQEKRQNVGN